MEAVVFEALEPQREAWRLLFDPSIPAESAIAAAAVEYRGHLTELAASGSARFLDARGIRNESDTSALTHVWMGLVHALVQWWLDHPDESATAMSQRCERLLGAIQN